MGITDRDRKRLAALILLIRPARVEALLPADREAYDRYAERMSDWIKACEARNDMDEIEPAARPYAKMIDGYGPQLPSAITIALFGKLPRILTTMSDVEATQIWFDEVQQ
ncbi:hypothetical protein QCM77_25065 [Bradyrhizobium sp. SSUT18]|uniref:hypothetical protein n=1 Tax=Bradyrhizobium sp. SSUT18 TaxID=3040602 RepID=UPI00244B60FD|nr:hypothetical protein [Bradyrhizobium sp. SSUT18]MDH2403193.1 hypothetical protein [Bradyrhizobium sp. SSUT18]